MPVQKILIIRFSSIGDIVLTTPVIRCLKLQLPGVELHYLTKPVYHTLLEANPYIDKIHVLKPSLNETVKELRQENFDCIIDLHRNIRTFWIKQRLGVLSNSFNKLNLLKWLMVNFKINQLPRVHIVDRYLQTVKHLEVYNDEKGLDYFIPSDTPILPHLPATFIAAAIGAQHATKRLPTDKLISICSQLSVPVLLLGGKEDQETGNAIVQASGNHVQNLCGALSIHQSALVIELASLVLTHDTGLMHIAAAFQKPIVSVWGNTIPAFGMYPYYGSQTNRNTTFEVKDLSCRPCTKIGYAQCPKGHFKCMRDQPTDAIVKALQSVK
ncbi:MAG: glycosyltransferase family 9 protein [Bacteroidia bacterium]|jgi:ADP-heptose:LPS heptosyltransferase